MTCRKLKKVLACNDFDKELSSKLVLEALFLKAEAPHRRRSLGLESVTQNRRFIERANNIDLVKWWSSNFPASANSVLCTWT
ncbi:hypothetical protein F3Y22_tig00112130pilonHSYRG00059 [Hibiscus syriacus]|uniref:Uncharacterized protein n=1 Tax=Hibiscus syriacus TaxID=106335 RepID=A0A6A2YC81_HIBSY|nr:hypothetical protein F3Y22_tig00112130pilonHSYRG00059 [Hibiscus syriacus]